MRTEIARTVREAEAQSFTMPDYDLWVEFAHLIDGYSICDELGVEIGVLRDEKVGQYEEHGKWGLTVLEARIILFIEARADRHMGGIGHPTRLINDLLVYIAKETGKSYKPMTGEEIEREQLHFNDAMSHSIEIIEPEDEE